MIESRLITSKFDFLPLRQFAFANLTPRLLGPRKSPSFTGFCGCRPNLGDWPEARNGSLKGFRLFSPEPRAKRFGRKLRSLFSHLPYVGFSPVFWVAALPGWSGEPEVGVAERTGACATNLRGRPMGAGWRMTMLADSGPAGSDQWLCCSCRSSRTAPLAAVDQSKSLRDRA
jgi:hypothetical protein